MVGVHADYEKETYISEDLANEILLRLNYAAWPGHAPNLKGIYDFGMLERCIHDAVKRKPRATSRKSRKKE